MNVQSMPEAPVTNGAGKSGNDSFVDSALEALGDLAGPSDTVEPARKTIPGKKHPQEDAPQTPEDDEQDEDPAAGEGDEEGDEEQAQEPAPEDEVEHTRGSKDEPFSVKDLPADRYIELKVDGEKTVVSLKELANGYIREQTFGQRINRTKQLADEATAHLQKLNETREQLRSATREFLRDPEQLYEYFTQDEEREQVVMALAQRLAAQLRKFREDPQARVEYERQRAQKKIAEERERWQQQQQAEAQAAQQREAQARFEKVFKPGWEEGLKKAGFPTPTQGLWEEVMVRLNQRHQSGKAISPEDVTEFVYRACKLLELPPRNANRKPRPAPATAPKERVNGKKKDAWADMPRHKRSQSADFFLKNLRPRDFR